MNETQHAINLVFKVGSHTTSGYKAVIKTLNRMLDDEKYDSDLILDARTKAFDGLRDMQLLESQQVWVEGEA